ncbi:4-hydroxythreonine-4-phosphate dehydrogenase PdxA [Phaeodactylibacter xiamenensis]|jgi:4-hydroxythreonine-4-phosphate dehydrogenase|uniref:4-hydroxythreonine-4-phosphate dehydrogenase n=1 Tax=Phaeodactylibacter xiamenensis TaxID=1524460 RepID=A0A098S7X4_9BACT|nr:4-hydroxythreonine-4-phosphate dehydrogenase PdxA [Phaeodactylibacter xiamenensis]KGE88674.1 4-hydroxythreonine-4-phosphate dehydrogenase [Phaeodactylibacter xiamenensis]MCR9055213.1 4-hydroxythreonine-4-phosphate dehydrogenase PdxA [bacterium]
MSKLKIGLSIGDINGIGLEVILKTFLNGQMFNQCTPMVYGSSKVVSYHKNIIEGNIEFHALRPGDRPQEGKLNVVNCWNENVNITLGKATELGGQYAGRSLEAAVQALKAGEIDALVTAPINKEAMKLAQFPFPGHTEYLARELDRGEHLMLMVNDGLRIGLATNHLPLRDVADAIDKNVVKRKVEVMEESLRVDFGIERPTIAVLGLNPHASDGGVIGSEEEAFIRPAIVELKKKGMMVLGPFPADGFFGAGHHAKFDGILAMYHDQGLTPFKALSFGNGVNYTAGLTHIRTSPDHGTAYDLAGKDEADPASFRQAVYEAIDIARNRKQYLELHENAMRDLQKPADIEGEDEVLTEDEN